jgi:hypothetical protein
MPAVVEVKCYQCHCAVQARPQMLALVASPVQHCCWKNGWSISGLGVQLASGYKLCEEEKQSQVSSEVQAGPLNLRSFAALARLEGRCGGGQRGSTAE